MGTNSLVFDGKFVNLTTDQGTPQSAHAWGKFYHSWYLRTKIMFQMFRITLFGDGRMTLLEDAEAQLICYVVAMPFLKMGGWQRFLFQTTQCRKWGLRLHFKYQKTPFAYGELSQWHGNPKMSRATYAEVDGSRWMTDWQKSVFVRKIIIKY